MASSEGRSVDIRSDCEAGAGLGGTAPPSAIVTGASASAASKRQHGYRLFSSSQALVKMFSGSVFRSTDLMTMWVEFCFSISSKK